MKNSSIHQNIMDKAYAAWRNKNKKLSSDQKIGYPEFLINLTDIQRQAVVLGNLNYQVENGGFRQWIDNGYYCGFYFLVEACKQINTPASKTVLKILNRFKTFIKNPKKNATNVRIKFDDVDEIYYGINSQFMADCEKFFMEKLARMRRR